MKHTSAELIAQYRVLPFDSDHLGDCAINDEKTQILIELDEYANQPEVSKLLLDILASKAEYDLARIEAAKIVGLYVKNSSPLECQLKRQVWTIFADLEDDYLVRQHASQNISVGFGGDIEHDVIERILFDDEDDESVRHGAFEYLRKTRGSDFTNRLNPKMIAHSYWGQFHF